jgi:hypothetical protein
MNLNKFSKNFVIGLGTALRKVLKPTGIKNVLPSYTLPSKDDHRTWSIQRRKTMARGEGI